APGRDDRQLSVPGRGPAQHQSRGALSRSGKARGGQSGGRGDAAARARHVETDGVRLMTVRERYRATRRGFLLATGSLAACLSLAREGAAQELKPTPACDDGGAATPRQTEGPFFKPRSPERADLREKSASGRPVELSGVVLTRRCAPVAGTVL